MEEGTLVAWIKKEGDQVEVDDLLAEVETDKATMEFRSFDRGVLLKILVPEGETLEPDVPVAIIGKAGEDISGLMAEVESAAESAAEPAAEPVSAPEPVSVPAAESAPAVSARVRGRIRDRFRDRVRGCDRGSEWRSGSLLSPRSPFGAGAQHRSPGCAGERASWTDRQARHRFLRRGGVDFVFHHCRAPAPSGRESQQHAADDCPTTH